MANFLVLKGFIIIFYKKTVTHKIVTMQQPSRYTAEINQVIFSFYG